ncbi:MAG: hypothetical protein WAQ24_04740 [Candidatus Saccharimonadales bacterium]
MRTQAKLVVALLAVVAVLVPFGSASAATSTSLSQVINAGTLSVDIVDGSGVSIASPAISFGATSFDFACQTTTATLGTATQKIAVKNPKKAGVKIDLNAVTPATDKWTHTNLTDVYKYNDAAGTGCTNGQMTVSGGTFTKTAGNGTPTYTMPVGAFSSTSPVTLFSNTGNVPYNGELTAYTLSQKIPAEQADGTYSLPMNITYVAQ